MTALLVLIIYGLALALAITILLCRALMSRVAELDKKCRRLHRYLMDRSH